MKAKNVMTREVAVCRPEDAMATAARIMWERDCGIVPIAEDGGRLVGVVTDRDLCMAAYTRNEPLSRMPVRDAMAREVFTCGEDDALETVHAAMREHQVRRLPVVDGEGRIVGMVSLNDLVLQATGKGAEKRQREVLKTFVEVSRHREVAAAV